MIPRSRSDSTKILQDDPNLPEKDLGDLKKYEDDADSEVKKGVLKNTDQPKVSTPDKPGGNFEKKMPEKTKQVDLDKTTTTKTPDLDPNTPASNQLPETNKPPEPSTSDLKKVETDLADGNKVTKMDSDVDTPKDQQVANGENPPKSQILEDNPNLKDKELDNFKKYEDDVDASTRKKMKRSRQQSGCTGNGADNRRK